MFCGILFELYTEQQESVIVSFLDLTATRKNVCPPLQKAPAFG